MKQVAIAAIILGIMYAPMEDYAKMFITACIHGLTKEES